MNIRTPTYSNTLNNFTTNEFGNHGLTLLTNTTSYNASTILTPIINKPINK